MWHRKDAIFCATVVGEPRQEDFFIGDYLQELLSPLFPKVMPSVERLSTFGETGFHCLAEAKVKVRYPREAVSTGFRILGEGQLSLTKVLMLTDNPTPPRPFKNYLESYLCRMDPKVDVHVFSCTSQDTLDYTGPKVNEGSKLMQLGQRIVAHELLKVYQWLILVDNLQETLKSEMAFLWTLFTRFEPAADVHAASQNLHRYHVELKAPLLFDARMKPWYPGRLVMPQEVVRRVDQIYPEIFPKK